MLNKELEFHDQITRFANYPKEKSIRQITFQITEDCSLRCTYCYQINKSKKTMTIEQAKKFIDYIFKQKKNPESQYFYEEKTAGFVIEFIGGEALLEVELIRQIIDYFEFKLFENLEDNFEWILYHIYNIGTNGVAYFNPEVQQLITDYSNLVGFAVTVDGYEELHDACRKFPDGSGSYKYAMAAAKNELKRGNNFTKLTIAPDNVKYVGKAIINFMENGFHIILLNCVFEEGWTIEHAKILYQELKKACDFIIEHNCIDYYYIRILDPIQYTPLPQQEKEKNFCGSTWNMIAMNPCGNLYPCLRFMESSLGNEIDPYTIGHIEYGIGHLRSEKKRLQEMENTSIKTCSPIECLNCEIGNGCTSCLGYCYQKYGTINKKTTFHCDMHRAAALAAYYLEKKTVPKEKQICHLDKKENILKIISEEEYNYLLSL